MGRSPRRADGPQRELAPYVATDGQAAALRRHDRAGVGALRRVPARVKPAILLGAHVGLRLAECVAQRNTGKPRTGTIVIVVRADDDNLGVFGEVVDIEGQGPTGTVGLKFDGGPYELNDPCDDPLDC